MEVNFEERDGVWRGQFVSPGKCDVMVIRDGSGAFSAKYGFDERYAAVVPSGMRRGGEVSTFGFSCDVPLGANIWMESKSEIKSCVVSESVSKVKGDLNIPMATEEKAGLMSAADKKKLNVLNADGYVLPVATNDTLGGVRTGHKNTLLYEYPVEVDDEGRAYVSVPQRELSGVMQIDLEAYANDYAGIWSTSASDKTHLDFVIGDNLNGDIIDTFRWRYTSNNLLGTKDSPAKPRESDLHTVMELKPNGDKGGALWISDTTGVQKKVLTTGDFADLTSDVTDKNVVETLKALITTLKG